MRIASLLLASCVATAATAAQWADLKMQVQASPRFVPSIALDRPGALEKLKATNPDHYQRAVGILRVASDMPCEGVPRVIQADFKAALAQCEGAMIRTSWPAQREVAFVLDGTRYSARVFLNQREALTPLAEKR